MRRWLRYHRWRCTPGHWEIVRTPRGYEMRWSVPVGGWYFYTPMIWTTFWNACLTAQRWNHRLRRSHPSQLGACRETFPDLRDEPQAA